MAKLFEYKIEKNVPLERALRFDETQPEYLIMMKMKAGDSFEFPFERVRNVSNCRLHIIRDHPEMAFTATGEQSMINKKLKSGRCWRLEDGSTKKYKNRVQAKKS
jgi:hypothetical protein